MISGLRIRALRLGALRLGATALVFLLAGTPGSAVNAQPVAPMGAPGPAMTAAARAAFEALDGTTRLAIQEALIWTGDYRGAVDGVFGPRTLEAIRAHQRRERLPQNGILLGKDIDELLAIAEGERRAVGFALVDDLRTGVRIGVPLGLMQRRPDPAHGGARWQTADERVTLDTRIFAQGEAELAGLFERLTGPAPGRQVTYRLLREDFLVVGGETANGRFYIRYDRGEAGIRGFTLGYDKALADPYEGLTLAIAGSFSAFPDRAPSPAIAEPAPQAHFGTGLLVARNTVLTSARLNSCRTLRAGDSLVTARERASEALLLTAEVDREPPAALFRENATDDARVIVLAINETGASRPLTATPGELQGGTLFAPLQPGATGAPVFSRSGRIVGIVYDAQHTAPSIAGIIPPVRRELIGSEAFAELLPTDDAGERADFSAGAVATGFGTFILPVFCDD